MKARVCRGLAWCALLVAFAGAATAEPVPTRPFLRIETGMHTAMIHRIDTDAAGRFLVTGSDDKTVRVWDLATGQLLRTLRPPIGEGNEGKIDAVAMTPDGELIAAGGSHDGEITTSELDDYLEEKVGALTQGAQTPILTKPPGVAIFVVLPAAKPAP